MTVEGIRRRLDKLAQSTALAQFTLANSLERAKQRRGRGEPEPVLRLAPPLPAGASRTDKERWRTPAHMRAREIFLLADRFDDLRAAYAMSDAELWQTLDQHQEGPRCTS